MSVDYDSEPMSMNGYLSTSSFPENDYEPDDSDTVYYATYEELEQVVARMVENAREAELVSTGS